MLACPRWVGSSFPRKRAVFNAKGAAISRPLCPLPHFHQLNAKILHCLKGAVQFSLIAKNSYQNRTVGRLLNMQPKRLERRNERIGQLSAYPDLISQALSATSHDCAAAVCPVVASAQITNTSIAMSTMAQNGCEGSHIKFNTPFRTARPMAVQIAQEAARSTNQPTRMNTTPRIMWIHPHTVASKRKI